MKIPRNQLVAVTGVSGSGKSSLAFGVIFAESQRRYLESVAPYARRYFRRLDAPDVDVVEGLPPAVALEQRTSTTSSRSTVGTMTTLSGLVRLLFSRVGRHPRGAPRLPAEAFSPNTAAGACPGCEGLGAVLTATEASMVPDPSLSIRDGAIAAWPGAWQGKNLRDICIALGFDVDRPWKDLPKRDRRFILFTDEQPIVEVQPGPERNEYPYDGKFVGARLHVLETLRNSPSERMRERARRFVVYAPCPDCEGRRLRPEALAVEIGRYDIAQMQSLPLRRLGAVLDPIPRQRGLADARREAARVLVADIRRRVEGLERLGLGYLQLDRPSSTLSHGELQRIRIATQLHSGLFGVVYVLDEPSAGLHPSDTRRLYDLLTDLVKAGNTVIVVEHDLALVRRADWVVDVGPGAGIDGGRIVYSGPVSGLTRVTASVTGRWLAGTSRPTPRTPREPVAWLKLRGARANNLHDLGVEIPLGVFTAVTGVSGAGKSSLVMQELHAAVRACLGLALDDMLEPVMERGATPTARIVEGAEHVRRVVAIDDRAIGRTPRSNVATYTGAFDAIRRCFARAPKARRRGWSAGHFSFNVPGGRCETCQGEGVVEVELVFLPSARAPCPACKGARFSPETLEVHYRGHDVASVLAMSVVEAATVFADEPAVVRPLTNLLEVGLGYLTLGQPAPELSGGEARRIKLAAELPKVKRPSTLYLFDEPTTSLHPADADRLTRVLHELVDRGHTVVVAEHDLDLLAGADWLIDLGPAGGSDGGRIVDVGPPRDVARRELGPTGTHLARHLELNTPPGTAPASRGRSAPSRGRRRGSRSRGESRRRAR